MNYDKIFKAYDIRGVFGQGVDTDFAYKLGRAFARFVKAKNYMVGYDARKHSRDLYDSLIQGLLAEGCNVTGLGMVSTPQLHYCQIKGGFEAGIMVTASHNPPQYHGFKFFDASGGSISFAKGLNIVKDKVLNMNGNEDNEDIVNHEKVATGTYKEEDRILEYIDFLASVLSNTTEPVKIKTVIDSANGSGGREFNLLSEKIGLDTCIINEEPDGNFPNHNPNPLEKESREQTAAKILETGADFGAVLDGDGDRIIFIDDKGEPVENYFISCLIAEELLKNNPGSAIVYDLISSRVLPECIKEKGGKPVVSKVGYTYIYDAMIENKALYGGETSGHVYFKVDSSYYTESAAYAFIMLLNMMSDSKEKLSDKIKPLKERYAQAPEINLEVKDKQKGMEAVEKKYNNGEIDRLDGLSISFKDFWFNLRPSNTEPLLRLRLEGINKEIANKKAEEIIKLIC